VVCAPCTTFSKLWNVFDISFPFSFIFASLFVNDSTICVVICSCRNFALSECACAILIFSSSISNFFCVSFSFRGSNWSCLACLLIYAVFNYVYRVFISYITFKHSVIDQNLDQGSKFSSKIKVLGIASKRIGCSPRRHKPNATRLGSNRCR
jgi:hypothetical protein